MKKILVLVTIAVFSFAAQANDINDTLSPELSNLNQDFEAETGEKLFTNTDDDVSTYEDAKIVDLADYFPEYFEGLDPESLVHKTAGGCLGTVHAEFHQSRGNYNKQRVSAWCDNGYVILDTVIASGGRPGRRTPPGSWTVYNRIRQAYSAAYNNASMPHFLVFHNCGTKGRNCIGFHGAAQHKVNGTGKSAGCARLRYESARKLYDESKGHHIEVKVF